MYTHFSSVPSNAVQFAEIEWFQIRLCLNLFHAQLRNFRVSENGGNTLTPAITHLLDLKLLFIDCKIEVKRYVIEICLLKGELNVVQLLQKY